MRKSRKILDIVLDKEHSHRVLPLSPVCAQCVHLRDVIGRKCDAFKGGIPLPVWNGKNNHRQPYLGDNGIKFEPIERNRTQSPRAA